MKIIKDPYNSRVIRVLNYTVNYIEAQKLSVIGLVQNASIGENQFTMITCNKSVTNEDIETVRRLLSK